MGAGFGPPADEIIPAGTFFVVTPQEVGNFINVRLKNVFVGKTSSRAKKQTARAT
jgi:hypothetical protein